MTDPFYTCRKAALYAVIVICCHAVCSAQSGQGCLPDCPGDAWNVSATHTMSVGAGSVAVTYRTRHACGTWYDVYIGWIVVSPAGYYAPLSRQQFMGDVVRTLLAQNPMAFPPQLPHVGCTDTVRVVKGRCWREDTPAEPGTVSYWSSCYLTTFCCVERFRICVAGDGTRTVTFLGGMPQACEEGMSPDCFPVCNVGYP